MSGATKRERATIGLVSLEWAVVDVNFGAWWYVMITVSHMN